MSALTLADANRLCNAACIKAEQLGVPMAVAVVDAGGHLVAFARMDGTAFILGEVAIGKAYTAASFGVSSGAVAERLADRTQFTTSIAVATAGRFTLSKGGLPLLADRACLGGIAASGGTGEQDLEVVEAAVANEWPSAPS
jgi:glc operon protein GlcG